MLTIQIDDPSRADIKALLRQHLNDMVATSPPESVHALDIHALQQANTHFFSCRVHTQLAGCGALKRLDENSAELKSMRTCDAFRHQGIASSLLKYIIEMAREQGFTVLYLETGTQSYFEPARRLYRKYGFTDCAPFADYALDPNSHYMQLRL